MSVCVCACVKEKVKFHDRKNDAFEATEWRERTKQKQPNAIQKQNFCARIRPVGSYFVIDSFSQIDEKFWHAFAYYCLNMAHTIHMHSVHRHMTWLSLNSIWSLCTLCMYVLSFLSLPRSVSLSHSLRLARSFTLFFRLF